MEQSGNQSACGGGDAVRRGVGEGLRAEPRCEVETVFPDAESLRKFAESYEHDPRLGDLVPGFDAPFFQAGLAGYSDAAMRIVARRLGCPYCVTEALLDRPLLQGGRGFLKADLGHQHANVPGGEEDHPLAGQLIGSEPGEMAQAAALLAEQGFEVIDINLACPVKKIARKSRGGHFLAHPREAAEMLRAVREAIDPKIPCTVKLRRGWDDSPEAEYNFEYVFNAAYEAGYAWATVHGRTVKQKYNGPSNWKFLRELVKRYPDRLILGSGDIWNEGDIFRMLAYTGVAVVAVARGCIGDPWLFRRARQMLTGEQPTGPTIAEQRAVLQQHFELSRAVNGEKAAGRMMRKFGIMFSRHHPQAAEVKSAFIEVHTAADWQEVLNRYYS